MPGPLLHMGATVNCSHAGQATPMTTDSRVTVSGQPVVPMSSQYTVSGCSLPPPISANGPCVTGQFMTSATRITASGQPILLLDSQSICAPTGTPLMPISAQTRVTGS